jgi:hypothetical protein
MARDDGVRRYVMRNQRARTYHRAFSDRNAAHDNRAASDRSARANPGFFELPIVFALRRTVGVDGARKAIVYENHTVSDKDGIFDDHARADEVWLEILQRFPMLASF